MLLLLVPNNILWKGDDEGTTTDDGGWPTLVIERALTGWPASYRKEDGRGPTAVPGNYFPEVGARQ
ncbi:hypothetical protein [Thermogemmatispora tikiterensis]|uniref:hypothetical protein n=1 Tax=Thermogemmatispora tikiterensis TaxID=1825093 RepID=UPI0011BF1947|nr:hypothetical protein [Thermogemmatispora tikiterensis]